MGWREDVVRALENLGGEADLGEIYREVEKVRQGDLNATWQATVRFTIETNSSDSEAWRKENPDLFHKVSRGRWGLRSKTSPPRVVEVIDQITRDDILGAIRDLDAGTPHAFGDSIRYDLVHDGKRYAPKAVAGLAARRQLGRPLTPDEFSGGIASQSFKVLQKHGFQVVEKPTVPKPPGPGDGILPETPPHAVWMEITKSSKTSHEHGGPGWEFGTCLWSPSAGSDGRDTYSTMREAAIGDLVIHSNDSVLVGFSCVGQTYKELEEGPPKPGAWAGRDRYYRVNLRDYTPFPRALPLAEFLRNHAKDIRDDIESNDPFKYPFVLEQSGSIKTVQGGYFTRCTPILYQLIRNAVGEPRATASVGGEQSVVTPATEQGRFWAIALGEGGRLWNECQEQGIVAIGWDYLGDLEQYADQDAITKAIIAHEGQGTQPTNQSLCCWQFANTMKVGDTVVAKIGRRRLLGIGTIESEYIHDTSRREYHNVRRVKWLAAKTLDLPDDSLLPTKTLTDVTGYSQVMDFVRENYYEEEPRPRSFQQTYRIDDAMAGLFMPREQFETIVSALRARKNVILQGPPGVGKTFVARRVAWTLLGSKDDARVQMVQFHQSYAYEDFIQGWRPSGDGRFQLKNGVFYEFCNKARMDLGRPYVFIADEINRGNLSKILGELMMLIEADKRGAGYAIPLTYSDSGERFSVPENLYVLGLMNTADRSLAMVDYALRRRFRFVELLPQFDRAGFADHLREHQASDSLVKKIVERVTALNQKIESDHKNLGRGFTVGHSFFCLTDPNAIADEAWYRSVIEGEIAPLIGEYWFDRRDTAKKWVEELLAP